MNRLSYEELPEVNSERWLSLEDLEGEEWKDIEGYEGIYMISDYGRVKSLDRISNGILHLSIKGKILRQSKNRGYWWVTLKDVDAKSNGVHRLVAYHFCERIEGKNHVDHIDTNRGNNVRENLHFVDAKGNANNPITLKRTTLKNQEINERKKKPIAQFDKDWNLIKRYDYINEAERETGIGAGAIIKAAKSYPYYNEIWKYIDYCTAGGYYWRYVR